MNKYVNLRLGPKKKKNILGLGFNSTKSCLWDNLLYVYGAVLSHTQLLCCITIVGDNSTVQSAQRTAYCVLQCTTVYYSVLRCTTVYYGVQCNTMYSVHVFSCCWAVLKSERWPWPMSGCKTTSCFDFYQINVYLRLKTKINQKVNG